MDIKDIINKFKSEYDTDIEFDEYSLREMLLKIPSLKSKWSAYLSVHEAELLQLKRDKDDLLEKLEKVVEEKSERPLSKIAKENMAKKHNKYVVLNEKQKDLELVIQYLERIHTNIQSITWEMKNIMEDMKIEKF